MITTFQSRLGARPWTPPQIAGTSPARTTDDLPLPDGPTTARNADPASRSARFSTSSSRPKKNSASWGWKASSPLYGVPTSPRKAASSAVCLSSVRGGGKSFCTPSITSWNNCSGRSKSLSRCSPMSRRSMPSSSSACATEHVDLETSTWPPCAAEQMRAVRCSPSPK